MTDKPIVRLVVSNAYHHRAIVARYGGKFTGAPKNMWRVPVIDGHVVNSDTGECFEPLGYREHLIGLGCSVAIVRAR